MHGNLSAKPMCLLPFERNRIFHNVIWISIWIFGIHFREFFFKILKLVLLKHSRCMQCNHRNDFPFFILFFSQSKYDRKPIKMKRKIYFWNAFNGKVMLIWWKFIINCSIIMKILVRFELKSFISWFVLGNFIFIQLAVGWKLFLLSLSDGEKEKQRNFHFQIFPTLNFDEKNSNCSSLNFESTECYAKGKK